MKFKIKNGTINTTNSLKTKLIAGSMAGILVLSLSGCGNHTFIDTKYVYNKAITIKDGIATIYDVEKWTDYDGEQLQLILKDGTIVLTSAFDTKLFNNKDSEASIEDIARSLIGPDGTIMYFGDTNPVKEKNR